MNRAMKLTNTTERQLILIYCILSSKGSWLTGEEMKMALGSGRSKEAGKENMLCIVL